MTVEREIERIVDEFEAAWQAGEPARIADDADRVDAQHRQRLLDVLIPLDVTLLRGRDVVPNESGYAGLGNHAVEIVRRELAFVRSDSGFDETMAASPLESLSDDSFSGNDSVLLALGKTVGTVPKVVLHEPHHRN